MPHTSRGFIREEVASRGLKKIHHCCILERRRIRDVDNNLRSLEHISQSLAGKSVDTRIRCRCQSLMSKRHEFCDELRSDKPSAPDNYNLHVDSLSVFSPTFPDCDYFFPCSLRLNSPRVCDNDFFQ